MNILIISQMYPCKRHPTSAIFFANLIKELAPKVNGIIVISPRPYIPKFMTKFKKGLGRWFLDPMISKENGIEIIRPYVFTLKGVGSLGINGLLMQYSLSNLIKKQIEKRKIKVVLGLNMLPDGVAAVRLAKSFKLPVITWAIGTDINDFANYNVINHYVTKKSIEKSELVLSTSKALESKIKKISDKYMQVRTFYRGIDIRNFQNSLPKQNLIKTLQLNPDKRFMLFVGRIIYDKG
ncbi:MAG: glycosyltransferase family 4 protein, partial [Hyphomicrobiales bacterium]|nr:glycosyltransferase family 4 protein [Hyphomicrobiales bacterium]